MCFWENPRPCLLNFLEAAYLGNLKFLEVPGTASVSSKPELWHLSASASITTYVPFSGLLCLSFKFKHPSDYTESAPVT